MYSMGDADLRKFGDDIVSLWCSYIPVTLVDDVLSLPCTDELP